MAENVQQSPYRKAKTWHIALCGRYHKNAGSIVCMSAVFRHMQGRRVWSYGVSGGDGGKGYSGASWNAGTNECD